MADAAGEFALNHTGNVYAKNDDGVVVAYANFDGTATGFGRVMGTMAFPLPGSGESSGTCTWTGQGFPPDSASTTSSGEGTWEQIKDKYAWRISLPVIEISDGRCIRTEGILDLEAQTLRGEIFDAS